LQSEVARREIGNVTWAVGISGVVNLNYAKRRSCSSPAPRVTVAVSKDNGQDGRARVSSEPVPEGWIQRYSTRVDLEASYAELEGRRHFHVESLRGHIRSLQHRFDDAWEHFERAVGLVEEAEDDIATLVRKFLLEIYRLENALLEKSLKTDVRLPPFDLPELPDFVYLHRVG